MCPGYHKQAECVVIKYVHAIFFNPTSYALGGRAPTGQEISGIWMTQDYGKQRFTGFVRR
jgi:hypothetical protein